MPHKPARILLVEDDRFLRKAAEVRLKRGGYTVTTTADGEEALATIEATAPDTLLLDLIMPKIQGFEVLTTGMRRVASFALSRRSRCAARSR